MGPFHYFVEVFSELGSCRNSGMGQGPIPFTSIVEYFRIFGAEGESFEDFLYLIRAMDRALLEAEDSKNTKRVKSGGERPTTTNHNKGFDNRGRRN